MLVEKKNYHILYVYDKSSSTIKIDGVQWHVKRQKQHYVYYWKGQVGPFMQRRNSDLIIGFQGDVNIETPSIQIALARTK